MILLPKRLGALAAIAAPEKQTWGINGVRVVDKGDGKYRAEATDNKRAVVVDGESPPMEDFPVIPGFDKSTFHPGAAIVPAKSWTEGFRGVKRDRVPVLEHLAIGINGTVTLASTDRESAKVSPVYPLDAEFPATASLFHMSSPIATVWLDASLFASLMDTIAALHGGKYPYVRIDLHGDGKPIHISAQAPDDGLRIAALIMPASEGDLEPIRPE